AVFDLPDAPRPALLAGACRLRSSAVCARTRAPTPAVHVPSSWRGAAQLHGDGVRAGGGEDRAGAHLAAVRAGGRGETRAPAHGRHVGAAPRRPVARAAALAREAIRPALPHHAPLMLAAEQRAQP